jgi:DNA-binding NtrC family response regulator
MAILVDGPEISADDVAAVVPGARRPRPERYRAGASFHDLVEEAEREILLGALAEHGENVSEAARALDLERSHLYKKMRALGIKRAE